MTSLPVQSRELAGKAGGLEWLVCLPKKKSKHPPLLFVHGAFCGAWIWADNFLPALAGAGYPAYALSLRGHGTSAGRDKIDWISVQDYLEDLNTAIDTLIAETGQWPVLVGHSMGGFVAQKYLESHPDHQIPALALLCSVPPQGLVAAQFNMLFRKPGLFLEINRLMSGKLNDLEVIQEALFAQPVGQAVLQRFFEHMQPESQRAIWDMSVFNLLYLRPRKLPPLLVAGAEHDVLVPPFLVRATAQTYGVTPHIFATMGHGITHEPDWQQATDLLLGWLKEQAL